ncbi:MAG TPA: hypothetical protein VIL30_05215 [Ramlibacter sp.]|jgi:hypothetical protein
MAPIRPHKPLTAAHAKTVALQEDVQRAKAELQEANETLSDAVVGTIVTKESVQAALVQDLQVEGQLHEVAKELQAVTELLKVAEHENAVLRENDDGTMAGRRSGEGVNSVMEHMTAAARRRTLHH